MRFFFCNATVARTQEALALGSMYSLVDEDLNTHTHGALNVFEYNRENSLVVIKANSILSVVAMVPFGEQAEGSHRFFLIEKFALGVVNSDDILD